jgi:hypothetical protein
VLVSMLYHGLLDMGVLLALTSKNKESPRKK